MGETVPAQVEVACVSHFLEARLLDKGYRAIRSTYRSPSFGSTQMGKLEKQIEQGEIFP